MKTGEEYVPDIQNIPVALKALDWRPMGPDLNSLWEDGSVLLVAVPFISIQYTGILRKYKTEVVKYDIFVINIIVANCDGEGYFGIDCNGDTWDYTLADIDFYVRIY